MKLIVHYSDHAGGNAEIVQLKPELIVCGGDDRIDGVNKPVKQNDKFTVSSTITIIMLMCIVPTIVHVI